MQREGLAREEEGEEKGERKQEHKSISSGEICEGARKGKDGQGLGKIAGGINYS